MQDRSDIDFTYIELYQFINAYAETIFFQLTRPKVGAISVPFIGEFYISHGQSREICVSFDKNERAVKSTRKKVKIRFSDEFRERAIVNYNFLPTEPYQPPEGEKIMNIVPILSRKMNISFAECRVKIILMNQIIADWLKDGLSIRLKKFGLFHTSMAINNRAKSLPVEKRPIRQSLMFLQSKYIDLNDIKRASPRKNGLKKDAKECCLVKKS